MMKRIWVIASRGVSGGVIAAMLSLGTTTTVMAAENKPEYSVSGVIRGYAALSSPKNSTNSEFEPSFLEINNNTNNSFTNYTAKWSQLDFRGHQGELSGHMMLIFADNGSKAVSTGEGEVDLSYIYLAYINYGRWQVGYNYGVWSTYTLDASLPILNWEGPNGFPYDQVFLVRWKDSPTENFEYQVGLENFPTSFDNAVGSGNDTVKASVPDLTFGWKYDLGWGSFLGGATFRQLQGNTTDIDGNSTGSRETPFGWGANASVKYNFLTKNSIMFGLVYTDGASAYYNETNLPDIAANTDGTGIDTVELWGGTIQYAHDYSDTLSSTFLYSVVRLLNKNETAIGSATSTDTNPLSTEVWQVSGNIIYDVTKAFNIGLEYLYGHSEWVNGENGSGYQWLGRVAYQF